MVKFVVYKDNIYAVREEPYVGYPKQMIDDKIVETIPDDYEGWFPFMRFCYSFGDLGILSGMFEAMKKKWPKIKIAVPSNEYVEEMFGPQLSQWSYDQKSSSVTNLDQVWGNNPYIDYRFKKGDFETIFTDHERAFDHLVHDGETLRSCDEPLAFQIARRFGFTEEDLKNIDLNPKLYFTDEEIKRNDKLIKEFIGDREYGCLLFASRIEHLKGRWDDKLLLEVAERFKNKPVFYFSEFNLNETEWGDLFPEAHNFTDFNLSIRDQIYIKSKSNFQLSYQAGVTDASVGRSEEVHVLCPYPTIRENCIRGVNYYFFEGRKFKYE
jgi:hypothetical protein